MAEKKNPQEDVRLLREEKGLLNDILNFLKKQQSARNDLQKSQTEANRIQKEFNSLIEQANRATSDRVDDLDATAKIQKQITREKILQGDIDLTIKNLKADGSAEAKEELKTYH